MNLSIVLAVICGAVALVGAFCVVFQIYQMTVIDATARGLKHPKFWGVFTMNGNNCIRPLSAASRAAFPGQSGPY